MKTVEIQLKIKKVTGFEIDLPGAPLVVAKGEKGFVMCGYLDVKSADKFSAAAAVVRGVKTVEDLLAGRVSEVSASAARMGVAPGVTGRDALEIFS